MSDTTWPCDNYTAPETCLTTGSTTRCDRCRERADLPSAPPPDHMRGCTHAACCNYQLCAHPACCGYPIEISTPPGVETSASEAAPSTPGPVVP